MACLFLDTNIFLDFYRFGSDDISEIGKLVSLISDEEVKLFSNAQIEDEVRRLREATLANSFAELRATKYNLKAPNYCEKMEEYPKLLEALKGVNEHHRKLVSETQNKILSKELPADRLIDAILKRAQTTAVDAEIYGAAARRRDLGNPPGKKREIGDAIHWECLLRSSVKTIDIVSNDGDFESELNPGVIKSFLAEEWAASKSSKYATVTLFKSLTDYFKERYPQIKLSDETKKRSLVQQLRTSPSFASTHSIIAELGKFSYFTQGQVNRLFEALVSNNQVRHIAADEDVREFFLNLKDQVWLVPDELHDDIKETLEVEDDFFFPF